MADGGGVLGVVVAGGATPTPTRQHSLPNTCYILRSLQCTIDRMCCLYFTVRLLVRGLEFGTYTWVWQHYGLLPTPDDSIMTAIALVIFIDLGYYWLHRASHEIMVLWAIHQVHHSSQYLTMTVGLRHSPLQRLFSWVFYLPLAVLGVPPAYMLSHIQFNLLYQCWLHTEAISTLGPLEYIFNTPNHHRVHHGSNIYCLDKNYGGVFIFWDYLFGTFQPPKSDEETVYGILVFYFKYVLQKSFNMDNFWNGLVALIKGPSWVPGGPWTGYDEDKIIVTADREYKAAKATLTTHVYIVLHLLAAITITSCLTTLPSVSPMEVFVYSMMVVAALTCIGILYEQPHYTRTMEVWRCAAGLLLSFLLPPPASTLSPLLMALYTASLAVWILHPAIVLTHHHCKQQ
ncbi:hypothetical protein Pmani_021128 [Petrolisthes manimaculis]|uniref:Fatty acid hydroxylase domain-containing protein n=1 Tax=Petrolisthes manimaculis TaxID=1843537 RepID=A0AAE1PFD9_9EUCA|nr:hypothetical protein Pmani_021128 [Petrolisthes manimaculis]